MSDTVIQLFAKAPIAGQVKTRLIPDIGKKAAAKIYLHCLKSALVLAQDSEFDYQLWLNQCSNHALFSKESVFLQQGSDLGEKMFHSLSEGIKQYKKVILIGSDCLDYSHSLFSKVNEKLNDFDLVIVAAEDGGYVLIAAKNNIQKIIFNSIEWGSDKVLKRTLEQAKKAGINTTVLSPLRDIDHFEDLHHHKELDSYYLGPSN